VIKCIYEFANVHSAAAVFVESIEEQLCLVLVQVNAAIRNSLSEFLFINCTRMEPCKLKERL